MLTSSKCNCPTASLWFYPNVVSSFRRILRYVSCVYVSYATIIKRSFSRLSIHRKLIINPDICKVISVCWTNLMLRQSDARGVTMTAIFECHPPRRSFIGQRNSFILCYTKLSNVRVNSAERADMCEISLIFELGWQWWYKRGTCTTRIVPCTGWQISPSRHPVPLLSPHVNTLEDDPPIGVDIFARERRVLIFIVDHYVAYENSDKIRQIW